MKELNERIEEARGMLTRAAPDKWTADGRILREGRMVIGATGAGSKVRDDANAALIAAAVNLLPDLLAERERLLAVTEALRFAIAAIDSRHDTSQPLPGILSVWYGDARSALARLDGAA